MAGFLLPFAIARADVPPVERPNPCRGRKAGEACETSGVCRESTCCEKRHISATIQFYESRKPRDQQNPNIIDPPNECSPCLACETPSQPPTPIPTPPPVTPTAAAPAAPAAPTAPVAPDEPAAATQRGACAVAPGTGNVGLILGGLLTLGFVRRRR